MLFSVFVLCTEYFEYFAPDFTLHPDVSTRIENQNSRQVWVIFLTCVFSSVSTNLCLHWQYKYSETTFKTSVKQVEKNKKQEVLYNEKSVRDSDAAKDALWRSPIIEVYFISSSTAVNTISNPCALFLIELFILYSIIIMQKSEK